MSKRNSAQQAKDRAIIKARRGNCMICGEVINYLLKWPDKRCFVVDHIIPLHKGGRDDITNKQAAHAACNSKKRARLVAPIVRRSGSLSH